MSDAPAMISAVSSPAIVVRQAEEPDRLPMSRLFAAVAEERDGIAAEPPVDIARRAARWDIDRTFVATAAEDLAGVITVHDSIFGFGEIAMFVAVDKRGQGVGTRLVEHVIPWAKTVGHHKLTLSVFPHNSAAIALYRKFGFTEEGFHPKHVRRSNGELWDLLDMALPL